MAEVMAAGGGAHRSERRQRALDHYARYEQARAQAAAPKPRKRKRRWGVKDWLAALLLFGFPAGVVLFVVGLVNTPSCDYSTDSSCGQVPWYGDVGFIFVAAPFVLLIATMWLTMVRHFSPNWLMRLGFGLLTLLLFGSGIGWLLNLYLYGWVRDRQPDLFTGRRVAPPQRRR